MNIPMEDPTKEFENKKFTLDCRQFMMLFINGTSALVEHKCLTDADQIKAVKALTTAMKAMIEVPDVCREVADEMIKVADTKIVDGKADVPPEMVMELLEGLLSQLKKKQRLFLTSAYDLYGRGLC